MQWRKKKKFGRISVFSKNCLRYCYSDNVFEGTVVNRERALKLEGPMQNGDVKENRIYIRVESTRKKCKTAILLYCFHTAGVLHIFVLFKLLGPGTLFYRKSKINIKRKPNYEKAGFIIDQ